MIADLEIFGGVCALIASCVIWVLLMQAGDDGHPWFYVAGCSWLALMATAVLIFLNYLYAHQ